MNACVRCGEVPPADDPWHRGVGASSRTDNKTKICNQCGIDEAMQDFMSASEGTRLTPQSEWPIKRPRIIRTEEA